MSDEKNKAIMPMPITGNAMTNSPPIVNLKSSQAEYCNS